MKIRIIFSLCDSAWIKYSSSSTIKLISVLILAWENNKLGWGVIAAEVVWKYPSQSSSNNSVMLPLHHLTYMSLVQHVIEMLKTLILSDKCFTSICWSLFTESNMYGKLSVPIILCVHMWMLLPLHLRMWMKNVAGQVSI